MMKACKITVISTFLVFCNAMYIKEDPQVETKYGIVEDLKVETKYGFVKGQKETSRSGRTYYAFKGIPYAKPPVKNLRFKAPLEPTKWTGVLPVQKNAPHCLQKNYLFSNPTIIGSEDCLYMNIYTPMLNERRHLSRGQLLPVMVFIHWGGFFTGTASTDYLGPEYLMDKDVILATFNYRLGVFGFFSTNDDAAPGNYGLKDQVAALRWIQNNIENFGGNNQNVTLFGQSAGGASVNFHIFSPESKNLFHRGISQSGTSLALWAKPIAKRQLLLATTQGKLVGCVKFENTTALVDCLRNIEADDLIRSGDKFKFFSIDPLNVYLPSVEKRTKSNPHPFITKEPIEYIRDNDFYKVPWIIGVVNDEGLLRAEPIIRQSKTRKTLIENFNDLMPRLLALRMSSPSHNISSLWTKIREFYFIGKCSFDLTDPYSIKGLINLYSDRSFIYPSYQTALFHFLKGHQDIWFYNFNYTGRFSYGNIFAATDEDIDYPWGVSHCDDLLYLFKSTAFFPEITDSNDIMMIEQMTDLWSNFAIYGDPTPSNTVRFVTKKWPKLDNNTHRILEKKIHYLNIAGHYSDINPPKLSMLYGFYENRFKFWEEMPLVENIVELDELHIDL